MYRLHFYLYKDQIHLKFEFTYCVFIGYKMAAGKMFYTISGYVYFQYKMFTGHHFETDKYTFKNCTCIVLYYDKVYNKFHSSSVNRSIEIIYLQKRTDRRKTKRL